LQPALLPAFNTSAVATTTAVTTITTITEVITITAANTFATSSATSTTVQQREPVHEVLQAEATFGERRLQRRDAPSGCVERSLFHDHGGAL